MDQASTLLASPVALSRHRPLPLYIASRSLSEFSYQVATVAVGWQIYALTGSAFYLGLAGLVQFIPSALLVFVAGQPADRYDRRRIVQLCELVQGLAAGYVGARLLADALTAPDLFFVLGVFGLAGAFESPASSALLPAVAPDGMLQRATALATGVWQVAAIGGPAIGGLADALSPAAPFVLMAALSLIASALSGAIRVERVATTGHEHLDGLFAGLKFVRGNPAILGTISLDLFAVLLGGATALLPIYAKDILQGDPGRSA